MSGDRPSARMVSLLCQKELSEQQRERVLIGLAQALTHGIDEVADYAAQGVSEHLWDASRELALRCVNALALQAALMQTEFDEDKRTKDFVRWRRSEVLKAATAPDARRVILEQQPVSDTAYRDVDTTRWIGANALVRLLVIVQKVPEEDVAKSLFRRASETLQQWWRIDDEHDDRDVDRRPHKVEPAITTLLERFVLRVSNENALAIITPILEEVQAHPREVSSVIEGLTSAEDMLFEPDNFWHVWSAFASRIQQSGLLERIDSRRSKGAELLSAIFLGGWWRNEIHHWRSLEGYAERVHTLFKNLPPSATVLDYYVRFLYHIGEQSLPTAFVYVSGRLREGAQTRMLAKTNTVFMLESLLRRFVYGRPVEIKRDREVREAILELLDRLVEAGSSAAYRMRDDFVTPLPA